MKARVALSLTDKAFSIELIAESEGESDFLALARENLQKQELSVGILGYTETNENIKSITFSFVMPEEKRSLVQDEEMDILTEPKKSYLH